MYSSPRANRATPDSGLMLEIEIGESEADKVDSGGSGLLDSRLSVGNNCDTLLWASIQGGLEFPLQLPSRSHLRPMSAAIDADVASVANAGIAGASVFPIATAGAAW